MTEGHVWPVFAALACLILPFWVLMLLLPTWRVSRSALESPWSLVPVAAAYVVLVLPELPVVLPLILAPDPHAQAAYFATPAGFLLISAHVAAGDLFVGRWVYLDGYSAGRSPWLMSAVLLVVMMLTPLGLLLYLAVRWLRSQEESRD